MIAALAFNILIVDQLFYMAVLPAKNVGVAIELICCALGFYYGFITVKFRVAYENSIKKRSLLQAPKLR